MPTTKLWPPGVNAPEHTEAAPLMDDGGDATVPSRKAQHTCCPQNPQRVLVSPDAAVTRDNAVLWPSENCGASVHTTLVALGAVGAAQLPFTAAATASTAGAWKNPAGGVEQLPQPSPLQSDPATQVHEAWALPPPVEHWTASPVH